jgi:UPF0755 protein
MSSGHLHRWRLFGSILVFLLLVVVSNFVIFLYQPPSGIPEQRIVEIPEGASLREAAGFLSAEGVITHPTHFILLARLNGDERRLQHGEYVLTTGMRPAEVLDYLRSGRVRQYEVVIPEGLTSRQIARLLAEQKLAKEEEFLEKVQDEPFARSLGIEKGNLEGYLFPDTYAFSRRTTVAEIIEAMVLRFRSNYTPEIERRARQLGMTRREVVTLASIIEKETSTDGERPIVSAVFHNRLKKKIPLQSDPTVIYGLPDFKGNLTRRDLRANSPYNTYRNKGLPPGPIANPGRASLEAAVNPAAVEYLYFVSKNDGTHQFSSTLKDHNRAVYRYQKSRSAPVKATQQQ